MEKTRNLENTKARRSRYSAANRAKEAPKSKRSRHVEVLESLLQYRFLSADDIAEILGTGYAHRRVLTELFHGGLVERRHVHTPVTRRQRGSPPAIYLLTPQGLKEWAAASGVDLQGDEYTSVRKRVASRARPKDAETEHTEHAWGVARFQRCLDRSAARAGLEVDYFVADREATMPEFTIPVPYVVPEKDRINRARRPFVTKGSPRKMTVRPDGLFLLCNRRGERRVFVLEFDNARRKRARTLRRALAYWTLVSTEEGREVLKRDLGGATADLVFVTPSAERRDQLRELTLSTPGLKRRALFWFVALPDLLQQKDLRKGGDDGVSRLWTVPGDGLFDRKRPIAHKLDGTVSPLGLGGFLT